MTGDNRRFVAQVMGKDSNQWQDVLYTDDRQKAARLVALAVESNPLVKDGRVVDAQKPERSKEQ